MALTKADFLYPFTVNDSNRCGVMDYHYSRAKLARHLNIFERNTPRYNATQSGISAGAAQCRSSAESAVIIRED